LDDHTDVCVIPAHLLIYICLKFLPTYNRAPFLCLFGPTGGMCPP
jgi:hypothetical protein